MKHRWKQTATNQKRINTFTFTFSERERQEQTVVLLQSIPFIIVSIVRFWIARGVVSVFHNSLVVAVVVVAITPIVS